MTRIFLWRTVAGVVCFLVVALSSLTLIPEVLYPPLTDTQLSGVTGAYTQIQLQQAQSQLQNNARSTLLQAIAGMLLVVGAVATWRQVQVNREGQLTERFTRAIDQLGSENTDIRIGGIYTLSRIADNSPPDRNTVQFVLGAFVRSYSRSVAGRHARRPTASDHRSRPTPALVACTSRRHSDRYGGAGKSSQGPRVAKALLVSCGPAQCATGQGTPERHPVSPCQPCAGLAAGHTVGP
jgi:hypothetical protein